MKINKKNIEVEKKIEESKAGEATAAADNDNAKPAEEVAVPNDTETKTDAYAPKETAPDDGTEDKEVIEEPDDTPIAIIGTTITEKKLAELKKKYGKRGIFKTRFINDLFVWHKLNRATFSKIISQTRGIEDKEEQNIKCEQEFVKASVIWPEITQDFLENEDVTVAGLSEEILYNSGFVPPQTERV